MLHSVKVSVQRACLEARFDELLLQLRSDVLEVDLQAHLVVSMVAAMAVVVKAFVQATQLLP